MKVIMRNYQSSAGASLYKKQGALSAEGENTTEHKTQAGMGLNGSIDNEGQAIMNWNDIIGNEKDDNSLSSILEQAKESSNFKVSASMPDVSVGELATQLARSETKMDVAQVSSKAMRVLANLKMALVLSDGDQKQKIQQMIRRMQKLTKKINQKIRNLSHEEQLELQRKRAEKQQKAEQETEIRKEIRRRKNKRHREEQNYASKEVDEDRKQALQDTMSGLAGSANAASAASGLPSPAAAGNGTAAYAAAASIGAAMESMSVDAPAGDVVSVDVAV